MQRLLSLQEEEAWTHRHRAKGHVMAEAEVGVPAATSQGRPGVSRRILKVRKRRGGILPRPFLWLQLDSDFQLFPRKHITGNFHCLKPCSMLSFLTAAPGNQYKPV